MPGSHFARSIILLLCGALAAFGCSSTDTEQGATGSLSLDLVLAGDIEIDVVDWQITGNGMDMGGSVDVSAPGSTASVEVYGLPVGEEPYVVELSAVSVDQQVTCRGSAPFDVEVGVSTPVMVILNCKLPQELGGVRVNGKFNICAQLTKMVVAPLQTSVGNDISLFSTASDEEGDPITYMWSSHSGSIADPMAASTTYTCTEVGDDEITVLVTDDDGSYCMSMWTVRVTCVAGEGNPCDDVTCDDDGNECTSEACNPGTGQCETSNVADGTDCDGGAGMCSAGTCVAKELCMDVVCEDDGNDCTAEVCNPDSGECETSNVDDGTSCDDDSGTCMNGQCVVTNPCVDVVCEDTGNPCTVAECNPANGLCEESNVENGLACDAGGITDLADNGGVEEGTLNGWLTTFCTPPDFSGPCTADNTMANTGQWSARIFNDVPGTPSVLKQANKGVGIVQPGDEVTITFWAKGVGVNGGVGFAEFFTELEGGGTSNSILLGNAPLSLLPDQFQFFSFTVPVGDPAGGGVTVQFNAATGATPGSTMELFVDDVSVTFGSGGGAGTCQEGVCEPIVIDLCEGNTCDDDDTECSDSSCDVGTGQCVSTPINEGVDCDGGAGTCQAGVCEPTVIDLCEGNTCDDDDTECSDSSCDAGTGQCVATPINEDGGCDGGAGTCNAGFCVPNATVLYEQNFEGLNQADSAALANDGWDVFGNVFEADGVTFFRDFGPFDAPNGGPGFCAVAAGQGGPDQGAQQLVNYSDYNNGVDQAAGRRTEALVFQEFIITGDQVGKTITLAFDAKNGDINDPAAENCINTPNPPCDSTAKAFVKTFIVPAFTLTNEINLPATPSTSPWKVNWDRYEIVLGPIVSELEGQLLQVGFSATAQNFEPSGVLYDNIILSVE